MYNSYYQKLCLGNDFIIFPSKKKSLTAGNYATPPKMDDVAEDPPEAVLQPNQVAQLSKNERVAIFNQLLAHVENGHLRGGAMAKVARNFGRKTSTVSRLWKRAKENSVNGVPDVTTDVDSRKKDCGAVRKYFNEDLQKEILDIPLRQRKTGRALASALKISERTILRRMNEKDGPFV